MQDASSYIQSVSILSAQCHTDSRHHDESTHTTYTINMMWKPEHHKPKSVHVKTESAPVTCQQLLTHSWFSHELP